MARPEALRLDVYVVTSAGMRPGRTHRDVAIAAVQGGATAVQLRAPELPDPELLDLARDLAAVCRHHGVHFFVNDRVDVAVEAGATGAHVGQDVPAARARRRLGEGLVLGISAATPEEAAGAEAAGADYLGVTVWGTRTKPEAVPVGLEGLAAVVRATTLPVVGIGGIDRERAGAVLRAGAAGVAVVSAVGAAEDPVAATRGLAAAVREARQAVPAGQGEAGGRIEKKEEDV
ncbi:MAG: thiamine phosphate synthase [Actinobacteria bacterium]|nr:thiamine phosphate synthase [Actinomycetota bacterium]